MRTHIHLPAPRLAALAFEPRWYALRTRARAEKQVDRLLGRSGVERYLPLVEVERSWSDRTVRVGFPLFPGYTFARFDAEGYGEVIRTPGVVEVVGGSSGPVPVRAEELEEVRRLAAGVERAGQPPELLDWWEVGTRVEVTSGPFRGMRGELVEVRGRSRLAVRITAIRLAASVELDPGSVRKVA